jgi:hypothetical protein
MKTVRKISSLVVGAVLFSTFPAPAGTGAYEEKFPVLQVGTFTYSNVTVTTKAKDYVFILHRGGMANLKVKDLPEETRNQLGYVTVVKKSETQKATELAKQTMAAPQVQEAKKQIERQLGLPAMQIDYDKLRDLKFLAIVFGILLLAHLLHSLCLSLICQKAGQPGGVMVWLPGLQVFPALRAAGMSSWWVLALLIPGLNVILSIIWCFKIAAARGKSWVAGLLLLLPLTNILAFLYLAFSSGSGADTKDEKPQRRREILVFETA